MNRVMTANGKTVFIVYFSAAGSTRHVAEVMEKRFKELGLESSLYDVADNRDLCQTISRQIQRLGNDCCLVVGSPVYVSHAAPPIMQCISSLASVDVSYAVPFVTWGGASSGISLFEMAKELSRKGFKILGAAQNFGSSFLDVAARESFRSGAPELGGRQSYRATGGRD